MRVGRSAVQHGTNQVVDGFGYVLGEGRASYPWGQSAEGSNLSAQAGSGAKAHACPADLLCHRLRAAHGLPVEGVAAGIWQRQRSACAFSTLAAGGLFLRLWQAGLAEYDEMEGIAWKWQSVDGATGKAPLAQQGAGPNPTDRGKKRTQAKSSGRRPWRPAVARRRRGQRA
jgi:hypothetical protein